MVELILNLFVCIGLFFTSFFVTMGVLLIIDAWRHW